MDHPGGPSGRVECAKSASEKWKHLDSVAWEQDLFLTLLQPGSQTMFPLKKESNSTTLRLSFLLGDQSISPLQVHGEGREET